MGISSNIGNPLKTRRPMIGGKTLSASRLKVSPAPQSKRKHSIKNPIAKVSR